MKKIFFTTILALLVCDTIFAQGTVQFSLKAGLNLAYEYGGNENSGILPGLYAGVGVEVPVNYILGIQPELMYSMQGGKVSSSAFRMSDGKERVEYINLPVIFKIYPGYSRRFSIDLGPQFGYMINAKFESDNGVETDFYDQVGNKFDFAAAAGVSYKILDGSADLSIRYNLGLTRPLGDISNKMATVQIGMGVRF